MKRPPRVAATAPMALLAAGILLAGCATREPSRQLYRWTDAGGSVRYTAHPDLVPSGQQHTRRVVEPDAAAVATVSPRPPALPAAPAQAPTPAGASPLDRRIAELEARIAADEEALKQLISDPRMADTLRSSPELRAIGERLPALQAELQALKEQRATGDGAADDAGEADGS